MASSVEILLKAKDEASKTIDKVADSINKTGESSKKSALGAGMLAAGFGLLSSAVAPYIDALKKVFETLQQYANMAAEAEMVNSRLEATLISTGRAAQISSEQLNEMATVGMRSSMFDDEAILEATNALLKFSSVTSQNIPPLTNTIIDMASAMGTDATGAADMLGRALESGVIPRTWGFSKALKAQIQEAITAGDESKALSLIMDELTRRYGGQGLAALSTYTGATAALKNEMNNMAEAAGYNLIPALTAVKFTLADVAVLAQEAVSGEQNLLLSTSTQDLTTSISSLQTQLQSATTYSDKYRLSQALMAAQQELSRRSAENYSISVGGLSSGINGLKLTVGEAVPVINELTEAQIAASEAAANTTMLNAIMSVQGAYDNLTDAADNYFAKQKEVDDLMKTGKETWQKIDGKWQMSAVPQETLDNLKDAEKSYEAARIANEKWIKQFLFSLVQSKLAEGGLDPAELDTLLAVGTGLGVIDPEVAATMKKVMEAINSADATGLDKALADMQELFSYDGKTLQITVEKNETTTQNAPTQQGFASGGMFIVPPGFPNDSYKIGLSSGEKVEVSTPGQQTAGGTVFNISNATFLLERGAEGDILARLTE